MDNAMNEMWRAQQNAAARVTEGWLGLRQPGANPTLKDQAQAPTGGDTGAEDTTEDTADSDTTPEVAGAESVSLQVMQAIREIQNLGQGQRDFAEHMTHWAELQHDLADSMTAWAKQQRDYADTLDRLFARFSGPVEKTV
jgi:hypothetical protein